MIDRDDIARAVRRADALAEQVGLQATLQRHEVDPEGIVYVAEQRALRACMMLDGRDPNVTRSKVIALTPRARELMPTLTALWMDAFLAGRISCHDDSHGIS